MKSEKLASLCSASDTRISGRVLAIRLSGRLGTDAVPPDAQWATDGLTDKKWVLPYASGSHFLSVRVGAYCIRPTRHPRQENECGGLVISQGNLLGSPGLYRARLWGVCCCAPTSPVPIFLTVRVGAYYIRPIRCPRKGDECGFWVMSMGHLLGPSGPCPSSATGWGLAPTRPHHHFFS